MAGLIVTAWLELESVAGTANNLLVSGVVGQSPTNCVVKGWTLPNYIYEATLPTFTTISGVHQYATPSTFHSTSRTEYRNSR